MFGYVRPSKQELNSESSELFGAYYCGLCKGIGKRSLLARLGLSFDMTFLLILLSALSNEEIEFKNSRCLLHRCKKEKALKSSKELDYVSDMSILLVLKKFEDDFRDDKSIKAFFCMLFYKIAARKIRCKNKEEKIEKELKRLSMLENENSQESDEVADCFAKVCEELFVPDFIYDENEKKALSWLGYNIGRWIYLIDAVDDIKKDIKKEKYNPFKEKFLKIGRENFLKEAENSLTFTLSNIGAAYDILDIKRNDEILKNIIYIGLYNMQNAILKKQENDDGSLQGSRCKSGR